MNLPFSRIPIINKRVKFPVTPHIPGGLTTPEQLRQLADIAETYHGQLKITGNSITIMGLSLADGEKAIKEMNCQPESFIAQAVRGTTFCAGKPDCPMAQQDSTQLGLALDKEFFGQELPGKLRIGVSGCPNCCAEVAVKDIGMYGTAQGYIVLVGGSSGRQARVARQVAKGVPAEAIAPLIRAILAYHREHGQKKERLGAMLERTGWEAFVATVIPEAYRHYTSPS